MIVKVIEKVGVSVVSSRVGCEYYDLPRSEGSEST